MIWIMANPSEKPENLPVLRAVSATMRYEAPLCPWCPDSIRAWREGQPFGRLSSVGDPIPELGLAQVASTATGTLLPPPVGSDGPMSQRIAHLIGFVRRKGYRKIGITTCGGSEPVVEALSTRLLRAGFEVILPAVLRQVITESEPWLPALVDVSAAAEQGCDPAAQADLLNVAGSDLNIAVGLCMGCDSLFFQHAEAPSTVLCCAPRQALVTEIAAADCGV